MGKESPGSRLTLAVVRWAHRTPGSSTGRSLGPARTVHPSSPRIPPAFQKLLCLEQVKAVNSFYLDLALKCHGLGESGPPDLGVFAAPVLASGIQSSELLPLRGSRSMFTRCWENKSYLKNQVLRY